MTEKVVFIFSGFSGKLLSRNENVCVKYIQRRGHAVHYFTNRCRDLFYNGGDDFRSADDLKAVMQAEMAEYDGSLALCASGGGFGGILHSAAVGVDDIVGYSAITTVDGHFRTMDGRGKKLFRLFDSMIKDPKEQNLRHHLSERPREGSVHLLYPENNERDVFQAENLKDVPGVTLLPKPSSVHSMIECEQVPFEILHDLELI